MRSLRFWSLPVQAGLYLLVVGALLALTDLESSWTLDDGAYATQVKVIDQTGDWAYPYQHAEEDPAARFSPVSNSTVTEDGTTYPYAKLPAWIVVLQGSTAVFGIPFGLYVPSVLGGVAAAAVAWSLSERLRPGLGPWGFWVVAGGPILIHTQAMWAHTAGAALGGLLAMVVVDVGRGESRRWHLAAMVGGAAALALIRREGLFIVGAAAATLLALPWLGASLRRAGRVPLAAAGLAGALGAFLVNRWWVGLVAPGTPVSNGDSVLGELGFVEARSNGFMRTFVDGGGRSVGASLVALLAVAVLVGAGVMLRRGRDGTVPAVGLVALGVGLILYRSFVLSGDLAGVLVAAPVLAVALGAWRWSGVDLAARLLVLQVALVAAAVAATQYAEGGALDWGGRFLFVVLVPATVVAVRTVIGSLPEAPARVGLLPLALMVLLLLPTVGGRHETTELRARYGRLTAMSDVEGVPTTIRLARFITRASWSRLPEADWLSVNVDTAEEALDTLRPGRTEPIAVVGAGATDVRADRYRRTVRSSSVVVFTPAGS